MEFVFESTDLDTSEELLRQQYTAMRLTPTGGHHLLRLDQRRLGRVRLDRNSLDMDVALESDPLGAIIVARVMSGRASYGQGEDERRYGPGDVYVSADPEDPFHATLRGFHGEIAVIDPTLLGEVAQGAPGSNGTVRLLEHTPVSAEAAALWWRTYCFVRDSTEASQPSPLSPIYEQEAARLLVAALLGTFPSTAVTDPTIEDRHDAHPVTLRRAAEFIEANAGREITPKEVADAAGVTIRAVQLAFRRHLDTTPTAYLRAVRLQYVHDELVAGDSDRTTVSEIAGRWGFANFGRFAAQYRTQFGELPGLTLRR